MAAAPIIALDVVGAPRIPRVRAAAAADYWALTKPEVNFLIVVATGAGFYLGCPVHGSAFPLMRLVHTVVATLLVASGAAALNQYVERRFDAQMRRTARRPLAAGRLDAVGALRFGVVLTFAGALYLAAAVDGLASALAVFTAASYVAVYTPLKRKTPLCTLVGACSGAMPPLIGWAAASGRLSAEAWILYGIVFLWQFPHFMAIAWMYREDYDRAAYLVLPAGANRDRFVAWHSMLPVAALIPLSVTPAFLGDADRGYLIGALLLGSAFAWYAARLALQRSNAVARRLLLASIVYLPALLVLLMARQVADEPPGKSSLTDDQLRVRIAHVRGLAKGEAVGRHIDTRTEMPATFRRLPSRPRNARIGTRLANVDLHGRGQTTVPSDQRRRAPS